LEEAFVLLSTAEVLPLPVTVLFSSPELALVELHTLFEE
jgi:hypothetical protein